MAPLLTLILNRPFPLVSAIVSFTIGVLLFRSLDDHSIGFEWPVFILDAPFGSIPAPLNSFYVYRLFSTFPLPAYFSPWFSP